MRKASYSSYIQPDSRGRIQLPQDLRKHPLFEIKAHEEGILLVPLKVVRSRVESERPVRTAEKPVWFVEEVMSFFKSHIAPRLVEALKSFPNVDAAFLYGSRARGDALSNSDFDIGLLCDAYPSFTHRNEMIDSLHVSLESELKTLESHGVAAELSIQFFTGKLDPNNLSPIYFSIVRDHRLIWQRSGHWDKFVASLNAIMKDLGVKPVGSGKHQKWTWRTGG